MDLQEHILALIDHGFHAQREFTEDLSPAERERQGEPDHWAPKDVLAHNAAWMDHLAENIKIALEGGELPQSGDTDEANLEFFQKYRQVSFPEIQGMLEHSARKLAAQVEILGGADLIREDLLPWQRNHPLWHMIVGTAFTHVVIHLADCYREQGNTQRAYHLQQAMAERLLLLDDSADWVGGVRYNLACCYALSGEADRALQELEVALALRPDLREWSRQDPDFTSLHGNPHFQALTADPNSHN